ncbi:hypothetical protein [Streptosporangium sp. NPDC051022]|uniref:hypothetical protein n=1 Tax=Streptosporangium sp. NPDC051022 TaxID=3155752 RepID=UPI003438E6A1
MGVGAPSGAEVTQKGAHVTPKGNRRTSSRHVVGQTELPLRHPAAYVSLYSPYGRRRMWWVAYRCPWCNFGHFGRVHSEESVEGIRRSGCGRLVWLVVARTYRGEVAA